MEEKQELLRARIDELCKERGLSYYTLSCKSGVPLSTLMHITDGNVKNPGIYTLVRLCGGMDVTLSEFFHTEAFDLLSRTAHLEE